MMPFFFTADALEAVKTQLDAEKAAEQNEVALEQKVRKIRVGPHSLT